MPNFFRIGQSQEGQYRNAGSSSTRVSAGLAHGKSFTTIHKGFETKAKMQDLTNTLRSKMVTASGASMGAGNGAGGEGNFTTNRSTAPNEKLDRDTFLDDIVPRGDQAQINMFNRIYREDAVSGSATDLIATAPWSGWTLSGISDPAIMRVYEETMERFNPELMMPDITRDFLKFGRVVIAMSFDEEVGGWKHFIPVDPLYSEILPVPIYGFEPLVNMLKSPEIEMMMNSKDKRYRPAIAALPPNILKGLKATGKAELDPLTTLYLRRKTSLTDWKGTSLYLRILPYYAIERALLMSTIAAARRRTRSILHITVGVDGTWEPTPDQLNDVITQFETSEEDPVGAIIATRSGIECNEVRNGGDFWKISEEADFINSSKLKALGISESLMSGEATINNIDASRSMFVESERLLRQKLTIETFNNKLFEMVARANGFVKRKKADVVHGVRTETLAAPSVSEAMNIPKTDLLMPTIHWSKTLSPESDQSYLDLLKAAKEEGLPVTLKMIASAAGVDLDALEQTLPEDKELRDRFKKFLPKPAEGEGEGGGGGGGFGSFGAATAFDHPVEIMAALTLGGLIEDDPRKQSVCGVKYQELNTIIATLTKNNRTQHILRDDRELSAWLYNRFQGDSKRVEATRYLLTRMGFASCVIDVGFIQDLAQQLREAAARNMSNRVALGRIKDEIHILTTIYKYKSNRAVSDFKRDQAELNHATTNLVASSLASLPLRPPSATSTIYAGV